MFLPSLRNEFNTAREQNVTSTLTTLISASGNWNLRYRILQVTSPPMHLKEFRLRIKVLLDSKDARLKFQDTGGSILILILNAGTILIL